MLMKPKRWLAYQVEVNDLLPSYDLIVDRFEHSDIPLDGTFGSNTEPGVGVPGLLIAIGPAVEPQRLLEILQLLKGIGQLFLTLHDSAEHSKVIFVGALNLNRDPVVAVNPALLAAISGTAAVAATLREAMAGAPQVHVMSGRDGA